MLITIARDLLINGNSAAITTSDKSSNGKGNGTLGNLEGQLSTTPCNIQNVKMIEMWICNLLNLPVPTPGIVKALPRKLHNPYNENQ